MNGATFVARRHEIGELTKYLDAALSGEGQVCFVAGEAGTGKTALIREFTQQAQTEHQDLLFVIGECNAQTGIGDPYLPFREILAQLTGDMDDKLVKLAKTDNNAARIRRTLARTAQIMIDVSPGLISLLVPGAGLAGALGKSVASKVGWMEKLDTAAKGKQLAADTWKSSGDPRQVMEQYTKFLLALAKEHPLLLVVDDLQWADTASIGLLFHLARRISKSRILLVGAFRPADVIIGRGEERHPLESILNELKRYLGDIEIDLNQAATSEAELFIDEFLNTKPNAFNPNFRAAFLQHTNGHPLCTIELWRTLRLRGDLAKDTEGQWIESPSLKWGTLPERVDGMIKERIDRLEEKLREILSIASVEGEEFTAQVTCQILGIEERRVLRRLSRDLERRHHLVHELGEMSISGNYLSIYEFSHGLFQQYLYEDLSSGERRLLHEDTAKALEQMYGAATDEISVQLAHHYQAAGRKEKAVRYLLMAGRKALQMSAHAEAITVLERGMELLTYLPKNHERNLLEIKLLITLGPALMALEGHSAPEVERVYTRAGKLCQKEGDTRHLFPVLIRLSGIYLRSGKLQLRQEVGEIITDLAGREGDMAFLIQASLARGNLSYFLGELEPAQENLEQVLAQYDLDQHRSHSFLFGRDPGVASANLLSQVLWYLGFPDQAEERLREGIALAREIDHPYSLGYAWLSAAILHTLRREWEAVDRYAEKTISISEKMGFRLWLAGGRFHKGLVLTKNGQAHQGIELMEQGLMAWRKGRAELGVRNWPALLSEAYAKAGNVEKGLSIIDEAIAISEKTRDSPCSAELWRVRGDLLRILGNGERNAHEPLHQSIRIAQAQNAKSWELRAAMSLGRLWKKQGKNAEAREMLEPIYQWFNEGLDTPDLEEAKALLKEIPLN